MVAAGLPDTAVVTAGCPLPGWGTQRTARKRGLKEKDGKTGVRGPRPRPAAARCVAPLSGEEAGCEVRLEGSRRPRAAMDAGVGSLSPVSAARSSEVVSLKTRGGSAL